MKARSVIKEVFRFNDAAMKNKKLTYFLILLVAGVWGMIIYRVFSAVGDGDDIKHVAAKPVKEAFNDYAIMKDTTKLLLNYRDPFGITSKKDTAIKITKNVRPRIKVVTPKPTINWSFITYSGYIRNPATKKLVALVSINGQNMTLSEGETKNQVKLLKNLRDSIKVSFNGKTTFIAMRSGTL